MVFTRWKGVQVVRQAALLVRNPNSRAQALARNNLTMISKYWMSLTDVQQAMWEAAAEKLNKRENPEQGIRALIRVSNSRWSGFNAFVMANALARSVGQKAMIPEPQLHRPMPEQPGALLGAFTNGGAGLPPALVVGWAGGENDNPDYYVRVWLYSEQGYFHKQMVAVAPKSAGLVIITTVKAGNGAEYSIGDFESSRVLIQIDVVDQASGWASSPSFTERMRLIPPKPQKKKK
jgi:hypothetical protein